MKNKDKTENVKDNKSNDSVAPEDAKDQDLNINDQKAGDGNDKDQVKKDEDLFSIDWGFDDLEDDSDNTDSDKDSDNAQKDGPQDKDNDYEDPEVLAKKVRELEEQNKTLSRREYIRAEAKKVSKKYGNESEIFPKFDESEVTSFLEKGKLDKISPLEMGYLMMNMKTILNNAAKKGASTKAKEYDLKVTETQKEQDEAKKGKFKKMKEQFAQDFGIS